jgi:hypothetical protein
VRAERVREGGVTPRLVCGAPADSGPKPVGAGGAARPCHEAGLNREGRGRLIGGVRRHSADRRGSNDIPTVSKQFKPIETNFKPFKFNQSKKDLPELKKIEIKYGFEDLEDMNNFLQRNFLRIGMDLELKFREFSKLEFDRI